MNKKAINNQVIFFGIIFVLSLFVGTFLNKIWTSYNLYAFSNLDQTVNYYKSDIKIFESVILNFKSDLFFILLMGLFVSLFFLAPVSIIIFIIKGMSVGYTINTLLVSLKLKAFKLFFITFFKNIIIVPGMIILLVFSLNHIKEVFSQIKFRRKEKIKFLIKRHLINVFLISFITCFIQALVNIIFMFIINLF